MDEFVSRMATQRHVLNVINLSKIVPGEKLFGLSSNAIERWVLANRLEQTSEVVQLLGMVSSELFFMSTRSQEPVSEEYKLRHRRVINSVSSLENAVDKLANHFSDADDH